MVFINYLGYLVKFDFKDNIVSCHIRRWRLNVRLINNVEMNMIIYN